MDAWAKTVNEYIKKPLRHGVVRLSRNSARHPGKTLLLTVAVSITLAATGVCTNLEIENTVESAWTPLGSLSRVHGHWVDEESGFPPPPRSFRFLIHSNGDNVLTTTGADCLFEVVDTIQSTDGYHATCQESWGEPDCPILAASALFDHNRTEFITHVLEQTDEAVQRAMSGLEYPDGEPVVRNLIFGYPQPELPTNTSNLSSDEDSELLQFASSYLGVMLLSPQEEISEDLEAKATVALYNLNDHWADASATCVVEVESERSFSDELERGILQDIPFMALAFAIMICFCAFYLLNWSDWVQSQGVLGIGAVATIIMSLLTGFGLLFCIGVPFSSITQIFPYILVGIGLDDTFIICGALSRTDARQDIVDRIVEVMEEVGVSVAFTTLTTVVAFLLGGISSLPVVRWFCWYAGVTVAVDLVMQLTFFIGIVVYDDRRIRGNRYDFLVCLRSKKVSTSDVVEPIEEDIDQANALNSEGMVDSENTDAANLTKKWMARYSTLLLQPTSKVTVLVGFVAMLALGAWGASRQRVEMDLRELTPPDSFVRSYYDALYSYSSPESTVFMEGLLRVGVYFRNVDVSSTQVQEEMNEYVNDLVDLPFITSQPDFFWLRDLNEFVANSSMTDVSFNDQVDRFLRTEPYANIYQSDVLRNENGTVVASRCGVALDQSSLFDVGMQINALRTQREVSEAQPINQEESEWPFFAFGPAFYAWEFFSVLVGEILTNVLLGLLSVFLISLAFIPHPIGALLLTPVVAVIYCELMAVLYVAGVKINGVTTCGLVMSIGLVVDYNAHIVLAYYETKDAATRNERVVKVLTTTGTSVLLGGFTTFLGVLPLSLTGSLVFRTFFYTFLGITGLSTFHGIVFVPVVLSLVGPHELLLRQAGNDASRTPCNSIDLPKNSTPYEIVEL